MENQKEAAGRPAYKVKAGAITVACWENEGKGMDGQPATFISLSIQRSYKDRAGVWQHATNFRIADIPKVEMALQEVYRHYVLKEVDVEVQSVQQPIQSQKTVYQQPRRY